MARGTPPAEFEVTPELARKLLQSQHPDLAHLDIVEFSSGWDNSIFRLGNQYTLRLPRRKIGSLLIKSEIEHLPNLNITLPAPIPIRIGTPTYYYPSQWTVTPWFAGDSADLAPPTPSEAETFADFLKALHQPASQNAPVNEYRGVPLASVQARRHESNQPIEPTLTPHLLDLWNRALAAPPSESNLWLHGDLHPQNILTQNGKLAAILDWGDLCSGDPATDLASFYMLFPDPTAISHYTQDPNLIARAQGWAIHIGTILYQNGLVDDPRHAAVGLQTLKNLELAPLMH